MPHSRHERNGRQATIDLGENPVVRVRRENIPQSMQDMLNWVLWRYKEDNEGHDVGKVPLQPNNRPASCNDPDTWSTFDAVWRAYSDSERFDGISFALDGEGVIGMDLDAVVDIRTGSLRPWPDEPEYDGLPSPDEILQSIDSYSEVSPGGDGLRIFACGELPWPRYKKGHLEIYNDRKFLTVTGDRCYDCGVVEDRPREIAALHLAAFGTQPERRTPSEDDPELEDQEILDLLARAANHEKFEKLYHNRGHGKNASSADMSLACLFAFYSRDVEQIERLMRGSSLRRDKWDRRDYLPRTIDHALEIVTEHYSRPRGKEMTDLGNSDWMVELHGADIRYCHPWSKWLVWDARRWRVDDTGAIVVRAKETVRRLLAESAKIEDDAQRKAQIKHVMLSESSGRLRAMISLAESSVPIQPDELDCDPFLINCRNGTLDLRTGELREHSREDKLTKLCDLNYRRDAVCPKWMRFLERVVPEPSDRDYLQRAVGLSLTGDVSEHVLLFLYGKGRNGKSTFLGTIYNVVGTDYAFKAAEGLISAKNRGEAHPTERADLFGRRMIICSETSEGQRLAEAAVKDLTGGDKISARRMREDFWNFDPTHKLWLAGNHKPKIRGRDPAIWSRVKLIPFTVSIPPAEQNKKLKDELKKEYEGILAWAVEGCMMWQEHGLIESQSVADATAEYRDEQDALGVFLDEKCEVGERFRCSGSSLYEAYQEWCAASGEHTRTRNEFYVLLDDHDFARGRSTSRSDRGSTIFNGIRLQP